MSILSGSRDTLLEAGGLSNDGAGRAVTGLEGTEATNGEASKLPVAEFGVGIEMVFGVMVSPLVSVSASLLSTSSTMEPLSVVRLSAGLYKDIHSCQNTVLHSTTQQIYLHYYIHKFEYNDLAIIHGNGGEECAQLKQIIPESRYIHYSSSIQP